MKTDKRNALRMLLYAVLYALTTAIVCVIGSIHPLFFVLYQVSAGILLSGIIITAFRRKKAPGAAACLFLGLFLLLLVMGEASAWHVIPVAVITVLSETLRAVFRYDRKGDVAATVPMTFSTFGYYGQIWFNRAYTYECALEEMPAGYADTLMALSPPWVFPVVIVIGIILSVWISKLTVKLFKLD